MKYSPSSVSGFTLTELMVVVAIAGILAAIAVPSFKGMIQSQRVRSASIDLYSNLILARSEAIKRNSNVTITPVLYPVTSPTPHDEKGWVIVALNDPSITADDTKIRDQSQLRGLDITVTPPPATPPWVTYRGSGRAASTPVFKVDVYGETTPYASCIKIELSGMPRIYKPVAGVCS